MESRLRLRTPVRRHFPSPIVVACWTDRIGQRMITSEHRVRRRVKWEMVNISNTPQNISAPLCEERTDYDLSGMIEEQRQ